MLRGRERLQRSRDSAGTMYTLLQEASPLGVDQPGRILLITAEAIGISQAYRPLLQFVCGSGQTYLPTEPSLPFYNILLLPILDSICLLHATPHCTLLTTGVLNNKKKWEVCRPFQIFLTVPKSFTEALALGWRDVRRHRQLGTWL